MPGAHGGMSLRAPSVKGSDRDKGQGSKRAVNPFMQGSPSMSFAIGEDKFEVLERMSLEQTKTATTVNTTATATTAGTAGGGGTPREDNSLPSSEGIFTEPSRNAAGGLDDTMTLFHYTFDTKTGLASAERVLDPDDWDSILLEWPTINDAMLTRPNRYVYLATFCDGVKTDGALKLDLHTGLVSRLYFGPNAFGGECIFVPYDRERKQVDARGEGGEGEGGEEGEQDEDDGCLMTYVWKKDTDSSHFVIFDAKTLEKVTEIDLHVRVPFGFHACWLPDDDDGAA